MDNREAGEYDPIINNHPPACTCAECTKRRLGKKKQAIWSNLGIFFSFKRLKPGKSSSFPSEPTIRTTKTLKQALGWLIPAVLIFSCTLIGFGISLFIGTTIPLWLLLGFSLIISIEKWFHYTTRKYKYIGKLYRLFLNLSMLYLLGLTIWSGIKLFSQQYFSSPLVGSLVFLAELVFFIWMWRTVSKNSWRWPSMKLTALSLIVILLIFAFADVQPMSLYKDSLVNKWNSYQAAQEAEKAKKLAEAIAMTPVLIKEAPSQTETKSAPTITQTLMVEEAEREAFELINALREEVGVPSTKWSNELYKLSKKHTQEMADRGELFHTPMEANHGENAWGGTGYHHYQYEELAKVIVSSWMSSPLHKAWLLHAPIKESVVSIVVIPDGQYASWSFWTSNLTRGPELIEEVAREWRNSGSDKPWIDWLISEGYLKP